MVSTEPEIVLDLSRLLSRMLHPTPTGIDRCEMAYARGLLVAAPERLRFAAVHPAGVYGRLSHDAVLRFLDATEARWEHGGDRTAWARHGFAARMLFLLRPRQIPRATERRIYLQPSPNNLTRPRLVRAILHRERAHLACLVHDLIPLQYPEYARPNGAALHARRIDTIARFADGIVANSHATLAALRPYIDRVGRTPATAVAHLGTDTPSRSTAAHTPDDRPYFVCIGTIEPRKNHLLLLNLWRRMAEERGAAACPRLLVIGRRGWEAEQVVDMLERCSALKGCVEEHGRLSDREVAALLPEARALLMPSFAEGYGMPVAEALSIGVPVICSDLPALREAGGDAPTFLDPLDGPSWLRAIDAHANSASLRTTIWQAPSWQDHLAIVMKLLHKLA